jgi:hypothetical protein
VTLNGRLAKLSVLLRLNAPTLPEPQDNCNKVPEDQHSSSSEPDLYCALPTMKAGKCSVGCAELNGSLLVCGGYDRVECLKSVDKYIPETNTWEVLAAMKEARGRFGIAVVNDKVYAIGGSNGITELATVEMLEPESGKWKAIANLPLARSNSGVCTLGTKIYCIGGWNGQVYCYFYSITYILNHLYTFLCIYSCIYILHSENFVNIFDNLVNIMESFKLTTYWTKFLMSEIILKLDLKIFIIDVEIV